MTGTDVLNLVPDEAKPLVKMYLQGLADAYEILKKKEEEENKEEKQ